MGKQTDQNEESPRVRLSVMATASTHGEDSPYFAGWKEYNSNPYDQQINPSGIIQMGLAENQVSFDLLEDWLTEHPEAAVWQENHKDSSFRENALYQDYHGLSSFRKAMARFMADVRGRKVSFDPDRIVLSAGATSANEILTFCLADPGDCFLVPTPYYPGFDRDLRWRTGVEILPVHCYSRNGFQLTLPSLEAAYGEAQKRNITVRGVLVTNPSNPLGTTLEAETLDTLLAFVSEKNIHLVCDEIYAGSVFSPPRFVSVAEILTNGNYDSDRVHIVYSLSKDLGLPGFRVAAIYSYNDNVVAAARRMSSFCLVSSQTQRLLASMLSDFNFTKKYLKINQSRLQERHRFLVSGLQRCNISCLESNAGLFCWVNLSHLLQSNSMEGELELWNIILHNMGLNVSPGSSFHCIEPGWFRVCFANLNYETLQVSLQRIQSFMDGRINRVSDPNKTCIIDLPYSLAPEIPPTSRITPVNRRSSCISNVLESSDESNCKNYTD